MLSLAYLSLIPPIACLGGDGKKGRRALLRRAYVLAWVMLIPATVLTVKMKVGGPYFLTVGCASAFAACVCGEVEVLVKAWTGAEANVGEAEQEGEARVVRHEDAGDAETAIPTVRAEDGYGSLRSGALDETEPTEVTPLLAQTRHREQTGQASGKRQWDAWFVLQVFLGVPGPVVVLAHVWFLVQGGLAQTGGDNGRIAGGG